MSPQRERIPSEGATRSRTNLAIRDYVNVSSAMWSRMAFLCRGTHRTTARRENVSKRMDMRSCYKLQQWGD